MEEDKELALQIHRMLNQRTGRRRAPSGQAGSSRARSSEASESSSSDGSEDASSSGDDSDSNGKFGVGLVKFSFIL